MFPYNTMMISRFFFPGTVPHGGTLELPEALAHHAIRVLRLRVGEPLVLFDGQGGEAHAVLVEAGKRCTVEVSAWHALERESPVSIVLVQALASADKMDWIVRKAVELGVSAIQPVQAARSVLRLSGERMYKRVAHWQQIVVSACEQSGRNRVPAVAPVLALPDYLCQSDGVQRLICMPEAGRRLSTLERPEGTLHVLIGPEGGWTEEEMAACVAAGASGIGLGPRVLRTETAGLAVLAAAQALWGDF